MPSTDSFGCDDSFQVTLSLVALLSFTTYWTVDNSKTRSNLKMRSAIVADSTTKDNQKNISHKKSHHKTEDY